VAAELAPKHWGIVHDALSISLRIAESVGVAYRDSLKDPAEYWSDIARNAHELLPSLGPDARMRVRATAFLFGRIVAIPETREAIAERCDADPTWPYCDKPEGGVAEFSVLQEAIWIGGTTDLFGAERNDAIARAFWRFACDNLDHAAIEDAWDRAAMAESMLDDDGELPWDDAKASLPN
jgi:hypothetical protein